MIECASGIVKTVVVSATLIFNTCAPVGYVDKSPPEEVTLSASNRSENERDFIQKRTDTIYIKRPQPIFNLNRGHKVIPVCMYTKRVKMYQGGYFTGYKKIKVRCGKFNSTKNKMLNSLHVH